MSNINYMLKAVAGKVEIFFYKSVLEISHTKQSNPEEYFNEKLHSLLRYCQGFLSCRLFVYALVIPCIK